MGGVAENTDCISEVISDCHKRLSTADCSRGFQMVGVSSQWTLQSWQEICWEVKHQQLKNNETVPPECVINGEKKRFVRVEIANSITSYIPDLHRVFTAHTFLLMHWLFPPRWKCKLKIFLPLLKSNSHISHTGSFRCSLITVHGDHSANTVGNHRDSSEWRLSSLLKMFTTLHSPNGGEDPGRGRGDVWERVMTKNLGGGTCIYIRRRSTADQGLNAAVSPPPWFVCVGALSLLGFTAVCCGDWRRVQVDGQL